jgi:hypothetical protein
MSNPCNNEMYVYSEDENNLKYIEKFISNNFLGGDLYDSSENQISLCFESRWTFPDELMLEMTNNLPNKDDIYIRCMSIELGNYYHELWIFEDNEWRSV